MSAHTGRWMDSRRDPTPSPLPRPHHTTKDRRPVPGSGPRGSWWTSVPVLLEQVSRLLSLALLLLIGPVVTVEHRVLVATLLPRELSPIPHLAMASPEARDALVHCMALVLTGTLVTCYHHLPMRAVALLGSVSWWAAIGHVMWYHAPLRHLLQWTSVSTWLLLTVYFSARCMSPSSLRQRRP